jgi:hypothetical protein
LPQALPSPEPDSFSSPPGNPFEPVEPFALLLPGPSSFSNQERRRLSDRRVYEVETVDEVGEQVALLQLEFALGASSGAFPVVAFPANLLPLLLLAVEVESVKPVVASKPWREPASASQPAFVELELQVVESVEPVASEPEPAS